MKNIIFLVILAVFFVACDSQRSFSAKDSNKIIQGQIDYNGTLTSEIKAVNITNSILKNNGIILNNDIATNEVLQEHENLIFYDNANFVIDDGCKNTLIVPIKNDKNTISLIRDKAVKIETNQCLVSASIKNNLLAYTLGDNSLFLYDLNKKEVLFQYKGDSIYAITNLNANPVFMQDAVIFPTLDGRLYIYNIKTNNIVKNIIIGSDKFLNNIIYLSAKNNALVAATQKRIFLMIGGNNFAKDIEINDIYFDGDFIYVLALDGNIYKFDKTLFALKNVKLPFAQLSAIVIKDNFLYTLEKSSHLLVKLNLNTFDYDLFDLDVKKTNSIFYTNHIFYVKDKFLDINKNYNIKMYDKK